MAVCAVQRGNVYTDILQCGGAVEQVGGDAEGGAYPEPAEFIFDGIGKTAQLQDIPVGDQSDQLSGFADDRKFFDLILAQDDFRFLEVGCLRVR